MLQILQNMISRQRPLRIILPLVALIGIMTLQGRHPEWSARPEGWTIDARFLLRGVEQPTTPIIIVALDEASFQILGDLEGENIRTWPRARWADLVQRIAAGHPQLIILDIVFDTPGWDSGGDARLASTMRTTGNVILPAALEQIESGGARHRTYSPPIDMLALNATGVGVSAFPLDADGAVRRLTVIYPWVEGVLPALSLVAATRYRNAPVDVPKQDLGADLSLPLRFRGPEGTFQTLPLHRIWLGEVSPEVFRDAIVLVGYTTLLEQDRHLAPFASGSGMPGVELHANAIDTLLAGDWLHRTPAWLNLLLVACTGLATGLALNLKRPAVGLALTGALLLIYSVIVVAVFTKAGLILPWVPPVASVLLVGSVALGERMIFVEREKRLMRHRFEGVMSPERLTAVMEHWDDLRRVERRLKHAAVLFADIRGFTHATETLMRQNRVGEMATFLSAYLDAMSAAVFAEGGVIYRMLGDGLLIVFGMPQPLPDYALHAVRAALCMASAAETLQHLWPLRDEAPLGMGIGLNAGVMADAIVGSGRRLDYAIIGDAVNTAARIEAHCKVAMAVPRPPGGTVPEATTILLGDDLYALVREHVLVDESIPPFEARGKSDPVRVVRLLGLREPVVGGHNGAT